VLLAVGLAGVVLSRLASYNRLLVLVVTSVHHCRRPGNNSQAVLTEEMYFIGRLGND